MVHCMMAKPERLTNSLKAGGKIYKNIEHWDAIKQFNPATFLCLFISFSYLLCVSEIYVLSKERFVCVVADCYVVDHSINILSWICFAWNGRLGPLWSWSYGSWIYNYLYNQCLPPLKLWVRTPFMVGLLDTTICDKVFQWLATSWWFSLGTSISSTNQTDCHDITEILLKVALRTINQTWNRFLIT